MSHLTGRACIRVFMSEVCLPSENTEDARTRKVGVCIRRRRDRAFSRRDDAQGMAEVK